MSRNLTKTDSLKYFICYLVEKVRLYFVLMPNSLFRLFQNRNLYNHQSYFPEKEKRKKPLGIFLEQVYFAFRYGRINTFYFPYGFDVKSFSEKKEYLHYNIFETRRDYLNRFNSSNNSCILRDKILFNIVANGIGIQTAKNVLLANRDSLYDFEKKEQITYSEFITRGEEHPINLFCKIVDGECGKGIFKLCIDRGAIYIDDERTTEEQLERRFSSGRYLLQEPIVQHPKMSQLHPQSINTIRLITVRNLQNSEICVFPSILRIGTGNNSVDNTSQGGVCVGIELSNGTLKEWGFYKPQFGTKVSIHPDSQIPFLGYIIPYFHEAVQQAIAFHKVLPNMHSIGWDIAIGDKGPVFVEGNDNWEINGPQICNGGLKTLFCTYFYSK